MQPKDLLFAKSHEWVHVDRSGGGAIATVGISHFAVEALTDLVYLEMPETGKQVKAGTSFGEIESVKAVSDLYAPVSGQIVEVNGALPDNLSKLNDDPYGEGWIVKIKLSDESELKNLLSHAAYEKQCAEEGH